MLKSACQRILYGFLRCHRSKCTMINVDQCAEQICQLVDQAGKQLLEASKELRKFETKAHSRDLVTTTDGAIEKQLMQGLQLKFPQHVYIGEEGTAGAATGRKLSDAPTWIIDPIDGTINFVHGFPYSCISVGFWLNQQPELAICYNPLLQQRFAARRNAGAYLNGQRIRVSGQTQLQRALIMHELQAANFPRELIDRQICNAEQMMLKAHALRTTGSAAMNLCLVALGAADGYFEFFPHAWDMAAGVLLVREAGGVIIDPAGGDFDIMSRRLLMTATPQLAHQMVQALANWQIYEQRDDV